MTAAKLITEISSAAPKRLDYLERRAMHTPMSPEDRDAVKRALAERRAYFKSPAYLIALARVI